MTRRIDILVVGGSAGALDPLMLIVGSMSADLVMPIGLVLHVGPRQSMARQLLSRVSSRRVVEPDDKEQIDSHTIYVAPPNYHLLVEAHGRSFALSVDDPVHFSRPSIDVLFESAADAFGARSAGIVLSGSNADGAVGLGRIAAAGGLAIVQAPGTAQQAAMPAAAQQHVAGAIALDAHDIAGYVVAHCHTRSTERTS